MKTPQTDPASAVVPWVAAIRPGSGLVLVFALLAALSLIVVGRYHPLGVGDYSWECGGRRVGAPVGGLAFLTRRSAIDAAIEIDRRFGLKERVSSAVAMSEARPRARSGRRSCGTPSSGSNGSKSPSGSPYRPAGSFCSPSCRRSPW